LIDRSAGGENVSYLLYFSRFPCVHRCGVICCHAFTKLAGRVWSRSRRRSIYKLVSALELHPDSGARTQRYAMQENDILSGDEFQPIALRQRSDEE
jgi:hypothetical protein